MIQNSMNISYLYKANTVGERKIKKRKSLPTIILSTPLNEKMYTKQEFVNILSPYKNKSFIKVKLMNEILIKKLVPACKTQLNILLKKHRERTRIIHND